MALLDFLKNRQAQGQTAAEKSQQQMPETAKEMYTRAAVEEKANARSFDRMPADQQAKAAEIKERLEKATQHRTPEGQGAAPSRSDSASSPQPLRQALSGQDQVAPALSPTTEQAGKTRSETRSSSTETLAKNASPSPARAQQTIARRPPSWER